MGIGMKKTGKKIAYVLFVIILVIVFNQVFWRQRSGDPNDIPTGANAANNAPVKEDGKNDKTESISLSMVGDVLLHAPVTNSGRLPKGTYNFNHLFSHISSDIQASDIAMVNQEVILGGKQLGLAGYPSFNGPYEVADAIANAGFNVVLHATNHALDKGRVGVQNCLNYWRKRYPYMKVVGINLSQKEQDRITVYEKGDFRVAILNYTYGTNGIPIPANMPYCVNVLKESKVRKDIREAKKVADFVVVCPHWGTEYVTASTQSQKKWAKVFLDEGVDLVIGTHPHVIGPVEWMTSNNGHKMLIYYSLGNFINASNARKKDMANQFIGVMAQVNIVKNVGTGKVTIDKYRSIPLITHWPKDNTSKITTYKVKDYSQKMAEQNRVKNLDSHFSYEYITGFCKKILTDSMDLKD
jgi:poly-gamma-glutamate synthesis protein (capsule biosynthesis protein)